MTNRTPVDVLNKDYGQQDADSREYKIKIHVEAVDQSLGKKELNEMDQVFNDNGSQSHTKPYQCTQDKDKLTLTDIL